MYYKIKIEGGFTGIPKEYQGEVNFTPEERDGLLQMLNNTTESNLKLRDGLIYHINIWDEKLKMNATYDESNLPSSLRQWIRKTIAEK